MVPIRPDIASGMEAATSHVFVERFAARSNASRTKSEIDSPRTSAARSIRDHDSSSMRK